MIFDASVPCDIDALHAQALELILRRAGLRTLVLTPSIETTRLGHALRALDPAAVVLTGRRVSLDAIGRLVYAVRGVVGDVVVFDYRGAVPDTGASTVCRLGEAPVAARDLLLSKLDERRAARAHGAERAGATGVARLLERRLVARERVAGPLLPTIDGPMASPHRPVDPKASFPDLEQRVLERWRERDVFHESVRRRQGAPQWGFYEGPPTANGPPGSHHVLARVFKDIFPRYKTMCGFYVERKGGWDCHGLPVELAVEAELGMTSKEDIERYGIAAFNARCREMVLSHVEDWNRLTERIGFWIDLDDAYRTLDTRLHRVGLVGAEDDPRQGPAVREAEGRAVLHPLRHRALEPRARPARRLPRRPRSERLRPLARSSSDHGGHRQGRRAARVDDDALDARLQRRGRCRPRAPLRPRTHRRRGALHPRRGAVERVLGPTTSRSSTGSPASALEGVRYEPPFAFISGSEYGPRGHTVLLGDFVTAQRRHRPRAHCDRVRRGRLPARRAVRAERRQPGPPRRHLRRADRPVRGPLGQGRRRRPRRGPANRAGGCCAPRATSTPTPTAGAATRR